MCEAHKKFDIWCRVCRAYQPEKVEAHLKREVAFKKRTKRNNERMASELGEAIWGSRRD